MDRKRDISRRGFLTSTGGALLATPLARRAAAQVPDIDLPELPGEKQGWAIVGLGRLAIGQILPAFEECRSSRLTAFVSGTPAKRAHMAQLYGVGDAHLYDYDSYDRMADDPEIDAVYVCLPNSMHAEYTLRALRAGKHVLCEKPMANTPAECEAMIAAAREADRKLMIAYRLRYEPFNRALIEIARDPEQMGPTRIIEAGGGFPIGDPGQWRLKRAMAGGGSLMDIGIYALNASRYLTGEEPVEVRAMLHSTPGDPRFVEVEENINFQLRFPSGILANCVSSYGVGINHFDVYKPGGSVGLAPALSYRGLGMHVRRGATLEDRRLPAVDHFAAEMDHFSECIASGREPLTPGEDGLADLRVMMAIYASAREGRPISLEAA